MATPIKTPYDTHRLLQKWPRQGLISADEAARIEASEAADAARQAVKEPKPAGVPARRPAAAGLTEALGYVGSSLIVLAVIVLIGRNWHDFSFAIRVVIPAVACLLLLGAGLAVPAKSGGVARRVQAVLWTASAGLLMGTLSVVGADGFDWEPSHVVQFAAGLTAIFTVTLWARSGVAILHVALFVALLATAGAAADQIAPLHEQAVGMGIWAMAAGWVLLGRLGLVTPAELAYPVGCLAAIAGAQATSTVRWGSIFAVLTTAAVIAFAVRQRSLVLLGVGTYGLLVTVPAATEKLWHGSAGVSFGLLIAGTVLVLCALWIMRRRDAASGTDTVQTARHAVRHIRNDQGSG
jgi:hypothetical protein